MKDRFTEFLTAAELKHADPVVHESADGDTYVIKPVPGLIIADVPKFDGAYEIALTMAQAFKMRDLLQKTLAWLPNLDDDDIPSWLVEPVQGVLLACIPPRRDVPQSVKVAYPSTINGDEVGRVLKSYGTSFNALAAAGILRCVSMAREAQDYAFNYDFAAACWFSAACLATEVDSSYTKEYYALADDCWALFLKEQNGKQNGEQNEQ